LDRLFGPITLLAGLATWTLCYAVLGALLGPSQLLNIAMLTAMLLGCGVTALVAVAHAPIRLWYPLPWFLLTSAIYYGFGPLLYYFGSPETVDYVDAFYPVDDESLWTASLLTATGIAGVLAVYLLAKKAFRATAAESPGSNLHLSRAAVGRLNKIAIAFVLIGVPVKVFLVLPRALGLWEVVLPGALEYFAVLSTLALVPLLLTSGKSWRSASRLLLAALLLFELAAALATLSKLAVLKVAIVMALASTLRGATFKNLALLGIGLILLYATVLTPLVTYGRVAFHVAGIRSGTDAAALAQDFGSGAAREELASWMPGVQAWWARLNYANAQAFAIDAYDSDDAGNTFGLVLWAFVPRAVYPDKPITTTGDKFNELVTGNPDSRSSPGMFVEGYWNLGWLGLVLVVVVMGLCYALWEQYAMGHLAALRLEYLPVIWIGLFTGIQQDSLFVPGIIGVLPIAIAFHCLAWFVFPRVRDTTSGQESAQVLASPRRLS
jgi:hypothetical protein